MGIVAVALCAATARQAALRATMTSDLAANEFGRQRGSRSGRSRPSDIRSRLLALDIAASFKPGGTRRSATA